ncbi:MAG: hypothetical protein AB7O97_17370 [Planctomycetota bacterium]
MLATRHEGVAAAADARVLLDADLGILGAEPARFDEYERQIRAEYAWVPGPLYRRERRKVLAAFAARPRLFGTAGFHAAREGRARDNLARALRQLG